MLITKALSTRDLGATVLRLALGFMFIAHAQLKLFTFGIAGTTEFFVNAGFPAWTVYPVIAAEIGGGVLLMLGVYSRWIALALLPILIGALSVHIGNGWVFTAKGGGWEYPLFLIVLCVVQTLVGDGAYALRVFDTGQNSVGR